MRRLPAWAFALHVAGALRAVATEAVIEGWTVKPFVVEGRFDHCNADAPTHDLAVVLFEDGRLAALVADPSAVRKGAQIDVAFGFDGEAGKPIAAAVVTDQLFLVQLGRGDAALAEIRKAKALRIDAPDKSYSFDVSRLAEPLAALQRCVAGGGTFVP